MLSDELQKALDAAFLAARGEGHELLTVEHLLLALLSDTNVSEVLTGGGADLEKLEQALRDYIRQNIHSNRDSTEQVEVQPTLSFQRVLQRAIYHVQAAGKKQVTTLNVLVALFAEKDTHAVYLLNEQGVTRSTSSTSSRTASARTAAAQHSRRPLRNRRRTARTRKTARPTARPHSNSLRSTSMSARRVARSIR